MADARIVARLSLGSFEFHESTVQAIVNTELKQAVSGHAGYGSTILACQRRRRSWVDLDQAAHDSSATSFSN
jgi:hypothetical protein